MANPGEALWADSPVGRGAEVVDKRAIESAERLARIEVKLDMALAALSSNTERLNVLEQRFTTYDARISSVEERLTTVDSRVSLGEKRYADAGINVQQFIEWKTGVDKVMRQLERQEIVIQARSAMRKGDLALIGAVATAVGFIASLSPHILRLLTG